MTKTSPCAAHAPCVRLALWQYEPTRGSLFLEIVSIRINGHTIELAPGSRIHTENSYKFTVETFTRELSDAGFAPLSSWVDDEGLFSIHLAKAV